MRANDTQVGGDHYVSHYQHWDFVAKCYGSGYFKGVITKYMVRWRKKNGLEDLQKARHYLVKLHELVTYGRLQIPAPMVDDSVAFAAENQLDPMEACIVSKLTEAQSSAALVEVLGLIDELITYDVRAES